MLVVRRFPFALVVVVILGMHALHPAPVEAQAVAQKNCTLTGTNTYSCTFSISPSVATGAGSWLVQTVTPGPGVVTSAMVTNASGCSVTPTTGVGTLISGVYGNADYDIVVGGTGCTAGATVDVTEVVTVTASGQLCQRVWVTTASPFTTACATVEYTSGDGDGPGSSGNGGSPGFTGSIAATGTSLVIFPGGSADALATAASDAGARSVWLTVDGAFVGYVVGAPAFVNATFTATFASGVPAGPVVVVK